MNFLRNYINYVATIGTKFTAVEWWYTSLSTKNRFQSQLLGFYEEKTLGTTTIERPEVGSARSIFKALLAEFLKSMAAWMVLTPQRCRLYSVKNKISLIKTFSYPANYSNDFASDAYWGKLPQYLRSKGPVIQLVRPLGCYQDAVKFAFTKFDIVPHYAFVSPAMYLRALRRLIQVHLNWRHEDPLIEALLRREFVNDSFFYAILMEEVFRKLTRKLNIQKVYIPFEGNAWERGVVRGSSENKVPVIGYVHTVVPEIATNLFPGEGEYQRGPFPHKILVLGGVPLKLLKEKGHYPRGVLEVGCALRFGDLLKMPKLPYNSSGIVLVVLEGVMPAAKIVDYILETAPRCPEWKFRLRFHPALPWDKMRAFCQHPTFPKNVEISPPQLLIKDIEDAEICLYWGSTAGIEALYSGRPVIHLDLGSVLSYDALFMHEGFHFKVSLRENLSIALRRIKLLSESEKNELSSESRKFLRRYFAEVTGDTLEKFL